MVSTGSPGKPPCTHRLLFAASAASASVRVVVTAPWIVLPVAPPVLLRSGVEERVTRPPGWLMGFRTFERLPHGPASAPLMPSPNLNSQPTMGVQLALFGSSMVGEIG